MAVGGWATFQVIKELLMREFINNTIRKVHADVLKRIMNAPVNTFFDVTPSGSIMTRFTEDMIVVEEILQLIMFLIEKTIEYMYMFLLIGWTNIWGLSVLPFLYIYYHQIWKFSQKAKR